ncbi:MAG: F0F1 ATP synthase subunit A [Eggerthellaceae bacterium]|nr:F0F1 ATP synthase subunit A [Eggerthellaceae bacterium]NBI31653.1 ATP synthase F0 subunit A [Enterorhabdus sp. P55]
MTQYVLWMVICWIITCVVVLTVARKLTLVPTNKFVNTVEYGYQFVRNDMGEGIIGHGYKKHVPFLATMFFFILISNFVGLIPGCKTPTGTISVTWALATLSFLYFNWCGIKAHGGLGYIKSIAPSGLPAPMVPIIWFFELISLILRWLTLAVRLYGNMFAGHMVLGIFALATGIFLTTGIEAMSPTAGISVAWFALLLVMYALETLVAFLQAYVFTVLTSVYISLATSAH